MMLDTSSADLAPSPGASQGRPFLVWAGPEMPASLADGALRPHVWPARREGRRQPILVIDDDPAIRDTVSDVLAFEGYEVVTAANGAEALAVLDETTPCLILLDMRMPVLDGWGFAEQARDRGLDVPILVLTAARSARVWAEEIGATDYLAKPFDLDSLLAAVERFC